MKGRALLAALLTELEPQLPAAVELRHGLHRAPCLSHCEEATAALVERALSPLAMGRPGGAARAAMVGREGRPVVVRAELDALPIQEQTGAPFAATNGAMHACGHDVHMAALVALCRAAGRLGEQLPAPLMALFQHSEEAYPSGAEELSRSPLLTDISPLAVVGVHVHPGVDPDAAAADPGTVNAAADSFTIRVHGRGGHAAYPHLLADPVLAISEVVVALQHVVSRRVDPLHNAVLTVARLSAGEAENVVPEEAVASGTLRTLQREDRRSLRAAVEDIASAVATAHRCTAGVTFVEGEPEVANDAGLTAAFRSLAPRAGLRLAPSLRTCGADDFGYYGALARTLMVFCGAGAAGENLPLHHPRFLPPDDVVGRVARAQAAAYVAAAGQQQPLEERRE